MSARVWPAARRGARARARMRAGSAIAGALLAAGLTLGAGAGAAAEGSAAPTEPFSVTALGDMHVQIESGGIPYVCGLTPGDGAVVASDCLPLVTPQQADAMAAAKARIAELEAALARARAEAQAQAERADAAEAQAETRAAELAEVTAALSRTEAELAATRDELAGAQARLAETEDLRYMAGLRGRVIDLEVNSVNVSLGATGQALPLARDAMAWIAETYGDGCRIPREVFNAQEAEIAEAVYTRSLKTLGVPDEVAPLMLASHPMIKSHDEAVARFEAALQAALDQGDGPTYDKGNAALKMARKAMQKLDGEMSKMAGSPLVAKLSDDQRAVVLLTDACKG